MKLENEFTVPASIDQAWAVLLDVPRVAPCLPGATVEPGGENGEFKGQMKVKIGPITASYKGTIKIQEADEAAHRVAMRAQAKDARGQGTASATITSTMEEVADGTKIHVTTEMRITGPAAQFGRGVMQDVSAKLMTRFAECLADQMQQSPVVTTPEAAAPAEPSDAAAEPPAAAAEPPDAAAEPPDVVAEPPAAAAKPLDAAAEPPDASAAEPPDSAAELLDVSAAEPPDSAAEPPDAAAEPPDAAAEPPDGAAEPPDAAAEPPEATPTETAAPTAASPDAAASTTVEDSGVPGASSGVSSAATESTVPSASSGISSAAPAGTPSRPTDDVLDLGEVGRDALLKRAVPLVVSLVALLLLIRLIRR